ncbi:MAG: hypothetical protein FD167_5234 [bacterium]|nr:MAG: hypothetical protein FD167_5234 [bacterium]
MAQVFILQKTIFSENNLFSNIDESRRPILGVVSYNKEKAYRRLFGKDVTYDKWVFIYMPPTAGVVGAPVIPNPINPGESK